MSRDGYLCHFCKKPVEPNALGTYRAAAGWIENRSGGGANALRPPKKLYDAFAHRTCLDLAAKGHRFGQESLL